MKTQSYKCDICGVEKREANHWLVARRFGWRSVLFRPWSEVTAGSKGVVHLCGQNHAHEFLNTVLEEDKDADTAGGSGATGGGIHAGQNGNVPEVQTGG